MEHKEIRVTALMPNGATVKSGWFQDVNKGDEYARTMYNRGCIVRREYR